MRRPRVYLIIGWGGTLFSLGFLKFGRELHTQGYEVITCQPDAQAIIDSISQRDRLDRVADAFQEYFEGAAMSSFDPSPIALIGYSLGANCAAWVANAMPSRKFRLVIGYDPTVNGDSLDSNPINANVEECWCYRNTSRFGTSLIFGGGLYVPGRGGPKINVVNVSEDHLFRVQNDQRLHMRTEQALSNATK